MFELLFDALLIVIVLFTAMAVWSRDLIKSVVFLSAAGVCTALVFFMLNAPDIAITKVAVEAGVATAVFIVAIQKTARFEKTGKEIAGGKPEPDAKNKVPASNGKSNHAIHARKEAKK